MSNDTHQHYFRRATVLDSRGAPMSEGRRCACGMETVGDGPLGGINANLVRSGQRFNAAMASAAATLAATMRAAQDRVREP